MIRSTFFSNRRRWYNRMPHRNTTIEHTRAPTSNKFPASQSDHLFEKSHCQRCPNTWVKDHQPFPVNIDLIDRMSSYLAPQMLDDPGIMVLRQCANHILEKASNSMFRYIDRLNHTSRFNHRRFCAIKLQNGIILFHFLSRPLILPFVHNS